MSFNLYDQEEREEEKLKPVAPSCYGCLYMLASPTLDCTHPNTVRVLWDPIRNRSYRIPSIDICREQGGMCKFYEPSPACGAEYSIYKTYDEILKKKKKDKATIDDRVETLIEGLDKEGNLDKFMDRLNTKYMKHLGIEEEEDVEEDDEEEEGGKYVK